MKDLAVRGFSRDACNDSAFAVITRVTTGCQHHAHGCALVPLCRALVKLAIQCRVAQGHQVGFQSHHDGLGFRITKATVVFNHLGCTFGANHQTGIQKAGIRVTLSRHTLHSRLDDFSHDAIMHLRCNNRGRGISAHTTSVRTGITFTDAFMILRGGHGQNVFTVHHDDETGFLTFEKFFNYHPVTCITKSITR